MTPLDGVDLASEILHLMGADIVKTREYGERLVHTFTLPGAPVPVLVGGLVEGDDSEADVAGARYGVGSAPWWIGADAGRYPRTPQLFDAVADAKEKVSSLRTLPGEIRTESLRLWVCHPFNPDDLSPARLRQLIWQAHQDAAKASGLIRGENAGRHGRAALDVDLDAMNRLWSRDLARGGHDPDDFPAYAVLGDPVRNRWSWGVRPGRGGDGVRHWRMERSPWPVPLQEYTVPEAVRWLEARFPPECVHVDILDGRILATGALGVVGFAIEDVYDADAGLARLLLGDRRPTFLDTAANLLVVFQKLGQVVERSMPRSQFGWLRPFTVGASSLTGQTEVRFWNPTRQEMEHDGELSSAAGDLALDPENEAKRTAFFRLAKARMKHASLWGL